MQIAETIVMVLHILASLILILVVLLQSGKVAGLSGSIAGGAETFFGKNKGRTLDAKLEKWTTVFAIMFLVTSVALSLLINQLKAEELAVVDPTDFSAIEGLLDGSSTDLPFDLDALMDANEQADPEAPVDPDAPADQDAPADSETPADPEAPTAPPAE